MPTGFGAADLELIEQAAADPGARAIGETGLDYFRDYAPHEDQRRAFEAQLELAARLGLPVVIHTRAAEDDTFALLREHADALPAVILHCFSAPDRLDEVRRARLLLLVRRQRHLPEGHRPAAGGARAAGRAGCWSRPTRPTSRRSRVRGKPNEPANVAAHRRASSPSCAASATSELEQTVEANAARVFGW